MLFHFNSIPFDVHRRDFDTLLAYIEKVIMWNWCTRAWKGIDDYLSFMYCFVFEMKNLKAKANTDDAISVKLINPLREERLHFEQFKRKLNWFSQVISGWQNIKGIFTFFGANSCFKTYFFTFQRQKLIFLWKYWV